MVLEIGGFSIFYIVYLLTAISFSIQVLLDNKTAQSTVAWILAMFLVPYAGVVFYLLSGINWRKRKLVKQRPEELFGKQLSKVLDRQKRFLSDERPFIGSDLHKVMTMTMKTANAVITEHDRVTVYNRGDKLFDDLLHDLEQAKSSIHIEYFIFRDDELGKRILSILKQKAEQGLEVRFLVDGAGSKLTFSYLGRRRLRKSKVMFRNFLDPGNIVTAWLLNYSSHRKIVVIDNKIGYTGGMNIGQEYIDGAGRFESWRDTHLRFEGDSVSILQAIFLADWVNSGGRVIDPERFFEDKTIDPLMENAFGVQLISSGPDSNWYAIQQLYFTMITNANERVIIQSPYFVPDESIAIALETAALSGIEVNLMMTGCPDKRIPYWVAFTFFEPLLRAGVNIYLYKAGFLHTKVVIADDLISTSGSCNMDQRSFFLDYELNAIFYDKQVTRTFIDHFEEDIKQCEKLTLEKYQQISRAAKFRNSVFRMISPLL